MVCLWVVWESKAGAWEQEVLATVPEGMRPPEVCIFTMTRNGAQRGAVSVNVEPSGAVRMVNHDGDQPSGDYIAVTGCWLAA